MLPRLYREEFTHVQALARFALQNAAQPLLFIKADSHVLKFLVRQQTFTLLFTRLAETEYLLYAAEIPDDPNTPGCCWSLAETGEEFSAIARVLAGAPCTVVLLNEQALPVCTATVRFHVATAEQQAMLAQATLCPRGASWQHRDAVDVVLRAAIRQQLLLA